jgi:hypothetical protein
MYCARVSQKANQTRQKLHRPIAAKPAKLAAAPVAIFA